MHFCSITSSKANEGRLLPSIIARGLPVFILSCLNHEEGREAQEVPGALPFFPSYSVHSPIPSPRHHFCESHQNSRPTRVVPLASYEGQSLHITPLLNSILTLIPTFFPSNNLNLTPFFCEILNLSHIDTLILDALSFQSFNRITSSVARQRSVDLTNRHSLISP